MDEVTLHSHLASLKAFFLSNDLNSEEGYYIARYYILDFYIETALVKKANRDELFQAINMDNEELIEKLKMVLKDHKVIEDCTFYSKITQVK